MASSAAATVDEYIQSLAPDRRAAITQVRNVILENLPHGYDEVMQFGVISYVIPLSRFSDTYNGKALVVAALASQKNYMTVYLMAVYGDPEIEEWFTGRYKSSGKKLDMGKSCVRFKTLDDLPLELIGETIAKVGAEQFLARYQESRRRTKPGK